MSSPVPLVYIHSMLHTMIIIPTGWSLNHVLSSKGIPIKYSPPSNPFSSPVPPPVHNNNNSFMSIVIINRRTFTRPKCGGRNKHITGLSTKYLVNKKPVNELPRLNRSKPQQQQLTTAIDERIILYARLLIQCGFITRGLLNLVLLKVD